MLHMLNSETYCCEKCYENSRQDSLRSSNIVIKINLENLMARIHVLFKIKFYINQFTGTSEINALCQNW